VSGERFPDPAGSGHFFKIHPAFYLKNAVVNGILPEDEKFRFSISERTIA